MLDHLHGRTVQRCRLRAPECEGPGTNLIVMPGHIHEEGKGMGDIVSPAQLTCVDTSGKKVWGELDPVEADMTPQIHRLALCYENSGSRFSPKVAIGLASHQCRITDYDDQ